MNRWKETRKLWGSVFGTCALMSACGPTTAIDSDQSVSAHKSQTVGEILASLGNTINEFSSMVVEIISPVDESFTIKPTQDLLALAGNLEVGNWEFVQFVGTHQPFAGIGEWGANSNNEWNDFGNNWQGYVNWETQGTWILNDHANQFPGPNLYGLSVDFEPTGDGVYTVKAIAQCGDGCIGMIESETIQFALDRTPPKVAFITPQNGDVVTTSGVLIQVSVQDETPAGPIGLYVDGVYFDPDNDYWEDLYNGEFVLPTEGLAAGTHTLTIKAWDGARNIASDTVTFTLRKKTSVVID